jgi:vanillate O-demethylase monooxygenase subunit
MAEFLRNTWYMIAWEQELGGDAMLSRRVMGNRILVFRRSSGTIAALRDRCPHRFARLSDGTRELDHIVCPYHGLTFDGSGACVRSPYPGVIPPNAHVDTYPAVAKHTIIWVWLGEPHLADEAAIPDLSFLEQPGHRREYTPIKADYRLVIDNLMDLSHVECVHRRTFGGTGAFYKGEFSATDLYGVIQSLWLRKNVPAAETGVEGLADGTYDQWADTRWHPAATITIEFGLAAAGAPRAEGSPSRTMEIHAITPETDKTSHYFYTWPPMEGEPSALFGGVLPIEHEDLPIIESVQEQMADAEFWSLRPVVLQVDAAAVRVRRRLAKMIAAEQRTGSAIPSSKP